MANISDAPPLLPAVERVPTIVLVGADKGGVGKTTTARALADWLRALKPRLIDTQVPAGDFRGFYPQAEILDLASTTAQMEIFDTPAALTIVNIGAGLLGRTIATLDKVGILKDVRAGTMRLVLLYLLGPSVASLSEVVEANRTISGKLDLFFVRNHINATEYYGWEKDPRFGDALAAMQPMIDVRSLTRSPPNCAAAWPAVQRLRYRPYELPHFAGLRLGLDGLRWRRVHRVGITKTAQSVA